MVHTEEKTNTTPKNNDVVMNVLEECGTFGTRQKKNGDEILRVDYATWNNNKNAKYEIRIWTKRENGEYAPGKGIGLSGEELIALGELIQKLQEESEEKPKTKKK